MGAHCSKARPHSTHRDSARHRNGHASYPRPKDRQPRLPSASGSWILCPFGHKQDQDLVRCGRFYGFPASQGHPHTAVPQCSEIRAVDRPCHEEGSLPPNIVFVTAVPLTRVFLARFSDLKDMLGKISSYDKVILSLLCCSRYTSP